MLDTKTLSKELTGIIGLYPGFLEDLDEIPADHHSDPQVFLSDVHKLLRTELLSDIGPQLAKVNPDNYDAEKTYKRYQLVAEQGGELNLYESLIPNNQGKDLADASYWRKTTPLSAWYGRIERGSIDKLARALGESPPPKPLMDRQSLYGKESNLQGIINKSGSFLGLRFRLLGRNTALNIARSGLQVTGPLTNMPLYIFHSESAEPVAIVNLTGTTSNRTIWANPNKYLFEQWTGYYLIGYFEADLPSGVSAIGGQRSFQVSGCSGCDPGDFQLAVNRSKYVHIQPVHVPDVGSSRLMTWSDEYTVQTQTWGINLVLEARCDVTQTILANKDLLTSALSYTVACDVLEELSTSDRVNATAAQFKNAAYVALYGQANSKTDFGLSAKRDKKIAELKAVMAGIAPDCMPAEVAPQTISFESMWD